VANGPLDRTGDRWLNDGRADRLLRVVALEIDPLMARPYGNLSAFERRDTRDKVMFGFVMGMRRGLKFGLPGVPETDVEKHVTIKEALKTFAEHYGIPDEHFNVASQEVRLAGIISDWREDQKTKEPQPVST